MPDVLSHTLQQRVQLEGLIQAGVRTRSLQLLSRTATRRHHPIGTSNCCARTAESSTHPRRSGKERPISARSGEVA
jgi:hypothetical protein